jgi:chromodomain-helicase-DNA-binding protein 1
MSVSQGLFAAFKVADFSAITRDDTASAAAAAAEHRRKAAAAHEAALAAVQKREQEDKELADDTGFWARLIPESERIVEVEEKEAGNAFGIVPVRKAAMAVASLNETRLAQGRHSSLSSAAARDAAEARAVESAKQLSREERAARESLNARDVRVFLRGVMRFGWQDGDNPARFDDIVAQGKLQGKDREVLLAAGHELLQRARDIVASPPAAPPADETAAAAAAGDGKKALKFDPMRFEFRGETVNAQLLVSRVDGLNELRKRLVALGDSARSFRLPVPVKAPPNGWDVGWSPIDDAMLLIGVFKYGVGAWQQIRDEPQLRLTGKIQQSSSAAEAAGGDDGGGGAASSTASAAATSGAATPGATSSHLLRRVETLLRELCRVTASAAPAKAAAAKRKEPNGGAAAEPKSAKSSKPSAAKKSAGAASAPPVPTVLIGEDKIEALTEKEIERDIYERAKEFMQKVRGTLDSLQAIPTRADVDAGEKRRLSKQYILEVGHHIERTALEKAATGAYSKASVLRLRRHMWHRAAEFTRDAAGRVDGGKLETTYRSLTLAQQTPQQS